MLARIVTTEHGTRHLIDFDKHTATRQGAPGREWNGAGLGWGPVTPDGEPFHFYLIQDATVGERMRLDNRDEWRLTSTVQSIEEAPHDDAG